MSWKARVPLHALGVHFQREAAGGDETHREDAQKQDKHSDLPANGQPREFGRQIVCLHGYSSLAWKMRSPARPN